MPERTPTLRALHEIIGSGAADHDLDSLTDAIRLRRARLSCESWTLVVRGTPDDLESFISEVEHGTRVSLEEVHREKITTDGPFDA